MPKKLHFPLASNRSKLSRRNSRIKTNFEAENYVKISNVKSSRTEDTKGCETIASAVDNVVKLLLMFFNLTSEKNALRP